MSLYDRDKDLEQVRKLSALRAHTSPSIDQLAQMPLAKDTKRGYQINLTCSRTGLVVGSVTTLNVAGHMPLLGQWKDTQVLHPLFSLQPVALLQYARNCYLRFCALSPEETADNKTVSEQEQMLQISALAMLHNLTEVRQDIPWLPPFKDVATHWTSLMSICYWRAYLDSQRFRFPSIRLSKMEREIDLGSFLKLCWAAKSNYEKGISEKAEAAKLQAADKAMVAIRDAIANKTVLSPRILWRWFEANISNRYEKDLIQWMWPLFTSTEKTIKEFTLRDIELFEEIFLSECPTGSSISHAFLEVLRSKHQLLSAHFSAFEIIVPAAVQEETNALAGTPEPQLQDFASRALWFAAKARWRLAQPSAQKHRDAEAARQQTVTVKASFIPKLSFLDQAIPEEEESDDIVDSGLGELL